LALFQLHERETSVRIEVIGGVTTFLAMFFWTAVTRVLQAISRKIAGSRPRAFSAIKASTLMSSSSSGQWIPSPRPIRRQVMRSFSEACTSRGYQASGTEIVRPSLRSTVNVSSVTATFVAAGTTISIGEELIPGLHKLLTMLGDHLLDASNLGAPEVSALG
jgi:hypothetical protein